MNTAKRILCLFSVVLGLAFFASQAAAATVTVTVGGTTYTLTAQNLSDATGHAILSAQPWWGNPALAAQISNAVQYQLGDLNGGMGPFPPGIPAALVAYGTSPPYTSITYWNGSSVQTCPAGCPLQTDQDFYITAVGLVAPSIPTLGEWGLMALALLIGVLGIYYVAHRRYA